MIGIFHKERIGIEFHGALPTKQRFVFQRTRYYKLKVEVNVIITNWHFQKDIFMKKVVILDFRKMTKVQGNYYRRTHHVNHSAYTTCLITHSICLTTLNKRSTRLLTLVYLL